MVYIDVGGELSGGVLDHHAHGIAGASPRSSAGEALTITIGVIVELWCIALNIKNTEVERLSEDVARLARETKTEAIRRALLERKEKLQLRAEPMGREERGLAYLIREVWPFLPSGEAARTLTKDEEETLLGFGPDGV